MIIEQEIKVKDRRTLKLVKAYARETRDEHYASLARSSEVFSAKWTVERFAQVIGLKLIPQAIGDRLAALAASFSSDEKTEKPDKHSTPLWRELLGEFLEKFIPRLIHHYV